MEAKTRQKVTIKEIIFYILGALLIAAFVVLYFPRFIAVVKVPDAIRYLYSDLGPGWAIAANAGLFILFLIFLPYRAKVEWKTKGVFSAFILALIAEMFGIPLLIYILAPLMEVPWLAKLPGGWANNPMLFGWPGAVIGAWLTLAGMVLVYLGWHQVHGAQGLMTGGLYKWVRHPQYSGFFLILTGWLLHWETTLTLVMYPILVVMYYFLAKREEKELLKEFGEEYAAYKAVTPMFVPVRLTRRPRRS
jgi:protein-S-isoprenylcysteine O-methyltransferase Ste14